MHPADLQPTDESHILIDCYFQDLTDLGLMLPLNISSIPADQSQMAHNETGICVTVLKSLQHSGPLLHSNKRRLKTLH